MERINKIVYGDNQFFGINHMSQEKAEQLAEKFSDIKVILSTYDVAINSGIDAIMLNSNERAAEITEYFRQNKSRYGNIAWYPSIPYPHKYANMVSEKGLFPAINEVLLKNNSLFGTLGVMAKGGSAILGKDVLKMMEMLIDVEMKMFKGLDVKVIFLQNIMTDLLLGYNIKEIFQHYCDYIRKKYKVLPGLITLNMPYLKNKLEEWGIEGVVICSSINKLGSNMFPSRESYEDAIINNNPEKYQLMAMSTLASGAIPAQEAYEYINKLGIQSVVFGASSEKNIKSTLSLINIK